MCSKCFLSTLRWSLCSVGILFVSVAHGQTATAKPSVSPVKHGTVTPKSTPSVEEATKFINAAEKELDALGIKAQHASWVQENFITDDTESIAADALSD